MKAKFRCLSCGYKWESEPGPTTCPKCGHFYVKWVNYEEWAKSNESNKVTSSEENY